MPDGTQWALDPGSDLVVQLHLQPTGKPEAVRVSVGFFFSDAPPARAPVGIRLGSERIDIAAGNADYIVADSYTLPADVELIAIQPHAHNLARRMSAVATLPNGTKQALISIADWDFRWQEIYRYAQPVTLPKGTVVEMRYAYDNSAANPRNPHRPPARVVWGQNTANEMGDLWLQVIPTNSRDLPALSDSVSRKMRGEDLAANLVLLNRDPSDPAKHDTVGIFYLQSGQLDEAAAHFRESLRLKPDSAPTHYNLGLAFLGANRPADAANELREAIRLDPNHADAHNSLGAAYQVQGQQRAAVGEYRRATALRPDQSGARANLAWLLAASSDGGLRDAAEAVRVAEEAAALTHREDPSVLDALAAAYASANLFDRAIANANDAIRLANAAGQTLLATQITQRRALYERGQPYRLQ
jgi:Flp pilus assembly protein TadD